MRIYVHMHIGRTKRGREEKKRWVHIDKLQTLPSKKVSLQKFSLLAIFSPYLDPNRYQIDVSIFFPHVLMIILT